MGVANDQWKGDSVDWDGEPFGGAVWESLEDGLASLTGRSQEPHAEESQAGDVGCGVGGVGELRSLSGEKSGKTLWT